MAGLIRKDSECGNSGPLGRPSGTRGTPGAGHPSQRSGKPLYLPPDQAPYWESCCRTELNSSLFFFSPFVPSRGVPRKTRVPAVTANVHVTGGPPREGQPRDGTAGRLQYKFGQGAALWEMNRPALPCPPARESPLTNHHMTRKVPAFPTVSVNCNCGQAGARSPALTLCGILDRGPFTSEGRDGSSGVCQQPWGPSYLSVKTKSPSFKTGTFCRGFTWAKASLRCWPAESPAWCIVGRKMPRPAWLCPPVAPTPLKRPQPQFHGPSPAPGRSWCGKGWRGLLWEKWEVLPAGAKESSTPLAKFLWAQPPPLGAPLKQSLRSSIQGRACPCSSPQTPTLCLFTIASITGSRMGSGGVPAAGTGRLALSMPLSLWTLRIGSQTQTSGLFLAST